MKYIFIAIVLTLTVAIVTGKRCSHATHCKKTECCLSNKGYAFSKGNCGKLAKEGEECTHPDAPLATFRGKYLYHCPCVPGLECKAEDKDTRGFFNKYICKPKGTITTVTTEAPIETTTAGKSKITDDEWDSRGIDDSDES